MSTMTDLLRQFGGSADAAGAMMRGMAVQPVAGLAGASQGIADLLRGKGTDAALEGATGRINQVQDWGASPFTQAGEESMGRMGHTMERIGLAKDALLPEAVAHPFDKLAETSPALAAGTLGFTEALPGPGKGVKTAERATARALEKAALPPGSTGVREMLARTAAAGEEDIGRSLKGAKKMGDAVPAAEVDAALANRAKYRAEPQTLPKKPAEMTQQDWEAFGAQHGADFTQQPMQSLGVSDLKTKREIMVPGGYEGKFTIPELFQIKANNFDPAALGQENHNKLMAKFLRTYERAGGTDAVDTFNDLNFSLLSPNAPLTPNEFLAQRFRARTPEDLAALAERAPGRDAPREVKQALGQQMDVESGTGAASRGGLGVKGTAELQHQTELARLLREKPEMFKPAEGETLRDVGFRVMNQVPGLSVKTASLGIPWTDLSKGNTSAVDLHMIRHGKDRLAAESPDFRQRWDALQAKNPTLSPDEAAVNIVGGAHPQATYRTKTGELHPNLPEYLQPEKLAFEPSKWTVPNQYYSKIMDYVDESRGANPAHELFPEQWRKWDVYRGRVEPHEMAHPDWRKLPKQSFNELQDALQEHKRTGYTSLPGAGLYPGDIDVQAVPRQTDWRKLYYGAATPGMMGATAGGSAAALALAKALRGEPEEQK